MHVACMQIDLATAAVTAQNAVHSQNFTVVPGWAIGGCMSSTNCMYMHEQAARILVPRQLLEASNTS